MSATTPHGVSGAEMLAGWRDRALNAKSRLAMVPARYWTTKRIGIVALSIFIILCCGLIMVSTTITTVLFVNSPLVVWPWLTLIACVLAAFAAAGLWVTEMERSAWYPSESIDDLIVYIDLLSLSSTHYPIREMSQTHELLRKFEYMVDKHL
jgi:uncharacterized membrane protein